MIESTPSYTLFYCYDANGHLAAINERHPTSSLDNWYYTVCNSRGDVIAIYDEDKYFFGKYTYDSWGKIVSITDEWGNDISTYDDIVTRNSIRYRGYVYDTEIGLYYLNSRYYDPETCRFISADDAQVITASTDSPAHDKNLYAYCDNNPIARADTDGDIWHIIIAAGVGAAIGIASEIVGKVVGGEKISLSGILIAGAFGAVGGALGASTLGAGSMIIASTGLSMAENTVGQIVENKGFKNFDVKSLAVDGAVGFACGFFGGPGSGSKHMNNLGEQSIKRVVNTVKNDGIKPAIKTAKKAATYYIKNTKNYYKSFWQSSIKDFFVSVGTSIITSK